MKKIARQSDWFYWWSGLIFSEVMTKIREIVSLSSFGRCLDSVCRAQSINQLHDMLVFEVVVLLYFCFLFFAMMWAYRSARQTFPVDKVGQRIGNALGVTAMLSGVAAGMTMMLLF